MKLTAVIVDDERRNRELLNQLLAVHCADVEVLATVASVEEAIESVNNYHPNILFLDVRIGESFGFDVLPSLTEPLPAVIITTAHEQYAIKAVKIQAVDYLLKPIVSDELKSAVRKVEERKMKQSDAIGSRSVTSTDRRITIPSSEGLIFIKAENIIRCEASGTYTEIYQKDAPKILSSMNLGEFETLLPETWGFLRVHHSSIINLAEVSMFLKAEGGKAVMSDKSIVTISQRKKPAFLEAIKGYMQ
jgi:two-component system LytT family response regulator